MKASIPEDKKATEYLANERTFLAWIRTCIAVISLGFVVAKFGVWLRELAKRLDPQMPIHSTGMSMPIGVIMMAVGGVLALLAAWHYHLVNQAIKRGAVQANPGLIITVAIGIALLAVTMIAYMLLTSEYH
jgi:putative membrane protein